MALNSDSYTNRDEKSGLFIALVWLPALSVFCFVLERQNPFSQSFVVLPAGIDKMVAQRTCGRQQAAANLQFIGAQCHCRSSKTMLIVRAGIG